MRKDDCFELGYVVKHRGLDGELTVVFDADDPDRYLNIDAIFVESKDNLIPYIVEYVSPLNDKFILKLEEIDDPDAAGRLKSSKLFLPLEVLPELDEEEFFLHDLVGFSIVDEQRTAHLCKTKSSRLLSHICVFTNLEEPWRPMLQLHG